MWGRVNVLVPELQPLIVQLARLFPDRAQRVQMEVSVGKCGDIVVPELTLLTIHLAE